MEKPYYQERPAVMLRSWVLSQMLRGAGYAAIVVVGAGLLIGVIYLVGLTLPADSRATPDPTPSALLSLPAPHRAA